MPLRSVLLAVHVRVLALLSGNSDVVTGVVTHNRPQHEAGEQVLGLFLNTIPIRVAVGRPSWTDLIRAVHDAEVAALPHRMYPLLEIQRVTGRSPAFAALFDYRDFHVYRDRPARGEPRITGYRFFEQTNLPFAANVIRSPADGGLAVQLKFDSRMFPRPQMEGVRDLYRRALQALAAAPGADPRPASPYLREDAEKIGRWNDTGRTYPAGSLPEMVAAQAARTPDAPALLAEGVVRSYRELASRVSRLARYLKHRGVTPGDVVGVCLHRGLDLVEAVHAVAAAGAAYLPLEPEHPPQRLGFMASDAGAALVITTSALAGRVPGPHVLCLDTEAGQIARPARWPAAGDAASRGARLRDLHVRFHRPAQGRGSLAPGIANRLLWMQEAFPPAAAGPGAEQDPVQLRRVGLGALLAADGGRAARGRRSRRAP